MSELQEGASHWKVFSRAGSEGGRGFGERCVLQTLALAERICT